jgi:hypothetical protein
MNVVMTRPEHRRTTRPIRAHRLSAGPDQAPSGAAGHRTSGPNRRAPSTRYRARPALGRLTQLSGGLAAVKAEAGHWLEGPEQEALRLRLEVAHAAIKAATVEARRRVRTSEGR